MTRHSHLGLYHWSVVIYYLLFTISGIFKTYASNCREKALNIPSKNLLGWTKSPFVQDLVWWCGSLSDLFFFSVSHQEWWPGTDTQGKEKQCGYHIVRFPVFGIRLSGSLWDKDWYQVVVSASQHGTVLMDFYSVTLLNCFLNPFTALSSQIYIKRNREETFASFPCRVCESETQRTIQTGTL